MIFLNWNCGTVFFSLPEYALNTMLPYGIMDEINAGSIWGAVLYLAMRVDLNGGLVVLLGWSVLDFITLDYSQSR
jgi:hypothetical protein